MKKIHSKITSELLHIIFHKNDFINGRTDIIEPDNFLQCSALKFDKGKTFRPHKHLFRTRVLDIIAQESWVIINGSIKCIFYDIDDTIIAESILYEGDTSFTLNGGHTYKVLENDTIVYEYKTGPYEGQKIDKIFI